MTFSGGPDGFKEGELDVHSADFKAEKGKEAKPLGKILILSAAEYARISRTHLENWWHDTAEPVRIVREAIKENPQQFWQETGRALDLAFDPFPKDEVGDRHFNLQGFNGRSIVYWSGLALVITACVGAYNSVKDPDGGGQSDALSLCATLQKEALIHSVDLAAPSGADQVVMGAAVACFDVNGAAMPDLRMTEKNGELVGLEWQAAKDAKATPMLAIPVESVDLDKDGKSDYQLYKMVGAQISLDGWKAAGSNGLMETSIQEFSVLDGNLVAEAAKLAAQKNADGTMTLTVHFSDGTSSVVDAGQLANLPGGVELAAEARLALGIFPEAPVILETDIQDYWTKCGSECDGVDKNDTVGFDLGEEKVLFYRGTDGLTEARIRVNGEWQVIYGAPMGNEIVWALQASGVTPIAPDQGIALTKMVMVFDVDGKSMHFISPTTGEEQDFQIVLDEAGFKVFFAMEKISAPLPEGPISELQKTLGDEYRLIQDGDHFTIPGVDNLKIFAGGRAELTIGAEVFTVSNLAVTNKDGVLTAGGWQFIDGEATIFGSGAPSPDSTPEQIAEWEAGLANFVVDEGASPEVQQAMIDTIHRYVALATAETAAGEFDEVYYDGEKIELEIPIAWRASNDTFEGRKVITISDGESGANNHIALKAGYANLAVIDADGKQKLNLKVIPMLIRDTDGTIFSMIGLIDDSYFPKLLKDSNLENIDTGRSLLIVSSDKDGVRGLVSQELQEFLAEQNQVLIVVLKGDLFKLPKMLKEKGFWYFGI
ncbi:MAG: hypothetical protein AAB430_00565 [Patescibacteria group bacterium]